MRSHELARRLLEMPDGPVLTDGDLQPVTSVWAATWNEQLTTIYLETSGDD